MFAGLQALLGDGAMCRGRGGDYDGVDLLIITAVVDDPDDDLSRMVLVYDEATGGGYAMNPPGPPDEHGNFPAGVYELKTFLDPDLHIPGETVWRIVVSDNMCNDTDIIEVVMPKR